LEHLVGAPKLSRTITHNKKLLNSEEALQLFFEVFDSIRKKLGPVLVQLPILLNFVRKKTENFYKVLSSTYKQHRFALEARDVSWFSGESLDLMRKYQIALVISQSGGRFPFLKPLLQKISIIVFIDLQSYMLQIIRMKC
jgi:uncharacterized protein YecE (DUF72 family)